MKPGPVRHLTRKWHVDFADVLAAVSKATRVSPKRIQSTERYHKVARARWIGWLIIRQSGYSFPEIGRMTGGFDHATVIHGLRNIDPRGVKTASAILGREIKLAEPVEVDHTAPRLPLMKEQQRREELFRENVAKWRELCAEDIRRAAA